MNATAPINETGRSQTYIPHKYGKDIAFTLEIDATTLDSEILRTESSTDLPEGHTEFAQNLTRMIIAVNEVATLTQTIIGELSTPVMNFQEDLLRERQSWRSHYLNTSMNTIIGELSMPVMNFQEYFVRVLESLRPHPRSWESMGEIIGQLSLKRKLEYLFNTNTGYIFEDGMDSEFSDNLVSLIQHYGADAVEMLSSMIDIDEVDLDVASEALRWLGRIEDSDSYDARLNLLEKSLLHKSPIIRDGAIIGLALLLDRQAVPFIQKAIEQETKPMLRRFMKQVLKDLENN